MKTWMCIAVGLVAVGFGGAASAQVAPVVPAVPVAPVVPVAPIMRVAPIPSEQIAEIEARAEALAEAHADMSGMIEDEVISARLAMQQSSPDVAERARQAARESSREDRQTRSLSATKEQQLYSSATAAMDAGHWERALELFTQAAALKGERQDGALYWKAYVQNKLRQRPEALATIQELLKDQPNSRWVSDAKALEIEVRNASGQPVKPETESDDELKLLALNGLMNSDADQAIGILQKLLQGPQSWKVKRRAQFVLSQNRSPKAREVLVAIAKGASNPDLQRDAINYLGISRSKENTQILVELYAAPLQSLEARKAVITALFTQGDAKTLVDLARKETNLELRKLLVQQLSVMKSKEATDFLMELINK